MYCPPELTISNRPSFRTREILVWMPEIDNLSDALYAVLHPLTRGRVDCLLLPPILEWPEVLLAVGLCGAAFALLATRSLMP